MYKHQEEKIHENQIQKTGKIKSKIQLKIFPGEFLINHYWFLSIFKNLLNLYPLKTVNYMVLQQVIISQLKNATLST